MKIFVSLIVAIVVLAQFTDAFQLWHRKRDHSDNKAQGGEGNGNSGTLQHVFSDDVVGGDYWDPFGMMPFHRGRGHHHHHHLAPFDSFWSDFDRSLSFFSDFNKQFDKHDLMKAYSPLLNSDLVESERDFHLTIDLPGVTAKDMDISIEDVDANNKLLKISAERKSAHETGHPADAETCKRRGLVDGETCEAEKPRVIRQERLYGKVERTFRLPANADAEHAKTTYAHGVLSISFPKLAQVTDGKRRTLHIDQV